MSIAQAAFPSPTTSSAERLIPTLHAVVVVYVARRPQSLVVQNRPPGSLNQLFAELVNRPQVVCRRRNLELARLDKLLVAAVQQSRDLAVQQPSRPRQN